MNDGKGIVPAGGYAGREWRDLPESYLYFIANRVKGGALGNGARAEVDRRRGRTRTRTRPADWKITPNKKP